MQLATVAYRTFVNINRQFHYHGVFLKDFLEFRFADRFGKDFRHMSALLYLAAPLIRCCYYTTRYFLPTARLYLLRRIVRRGGIEIHGKLLAREKPFLGADFLHHRHGIYRPP